LHPATEVDLGSLIATGEPATALPWLFYFPGTDIAAIRQ
jgi:hypothetical protein